MTAGVVVRPRREADLAACVAVLREVQRRDRYPVRRIDLDAWLRPQRAFGRWVAEFGGAVVGHVALVPTADGRAEVSRLFTAPAVRGRGCGAALLDAAVAGSPGLPVVLQVLERDDGAPGFYEHLGWRVTGREATDWVDDEGERHTVRWYAPPAVADGRAQA